MNKKLLFALGAAVSVSAGAWIYSFTRSNDCQSDTALHTKDLRSKKQSIAEPKGYAEWMRDIRTRPGDEEPYEIGYQVKEYMKLVAANPSKRTDEMLDWKHRGPGNVGTRVRCMMFDEADPTGNTWLAASTGGGIWKTKNAGEDWEHLTLNLPHSVFTSIAQCKTKPAVMYAGTGEDVYAGGTGVSGTGIFKSEDGGKTWTLLPSTVGSKDFINTNDIVVDPNNADIVIATTSRGFSKANDFERGIMRSTDGGRTWTKVYQPSYIQGFPMGITADPSNFNNLYVGIFGEGIVTSKDGGRTWQDNSLGGIASGKSGGQRIGRTEVAVFPQNSNFVAASVDYAGEDGGSDVFISEDGGRTWAALENGQSGYDWIRQGIFDNCITFNPLDRTEVFVGGVLLSRNKLDYAAKRQGPKTFLGATLDRDWLDFTVFNNGQYWNNRLVISNMGLARNVEIRFGGGKKQKAHRFEACGGNYAAGCPDNSYRYVDYIDVDFEVWDIEANKQLMVSFRDNEMNGRFDLNERVSGDADLITTREYIYVHAIDYDPNAPSAAVTRTGGHMSSNMYFMWPFVPEGKRWDKSLLTTLRISVGNVTFMRGTTTELCDLNPSNWLVNPHVDFHSLVTRDMGNGKYRMIIGNDGGIAFTDDASNARNADGKIKQVGNGSYSTALCYTVAKKPKENAFLMGAQDQGVFFSMKDPKPGDPWKSADLFADGFGVVWHYGDGRRMVVTAQNNLRMRHTRDGGNVWSSSSIRDQGAGAAPFFSRLESSDKNPDHVFSVGQSGVWKSTDGGQRFSVKRMGDGWLGSLGAMQVRVSPVDPNIVWSGSSFGTSADGTEFSIFVSTDGGEKFTKTKMYVSGRKNAQGQLLNMGSISGMVPDPNNKNGLFVTFAQPRGPKVVYTPDMGKTWRDISGFDDQISSKKGFPDVGTYTFLVFPDGKKMWAGTDIGLVESLDGGETWKLANNGFPNVPVYDIRVRDGVVAIGTHGLGVYSVDLGLDYGSGNPDPDPDPDPTGLFSDSKAVKINLYPNPTSDVIRFELPSAGTDYNVSIFAVSGQKVQAMSLKGGLQELNVKNLNKGTYIFQAVGDGKTFAQKFVVE
jgi:photosystem II stability/assembly factor-like uncharacterized protein